MEPEIIAIFVIIVGAIILYASEIIPADATSILIMVILMISGLVTAEEGISGFSNRATITVLALLIISAGLQNSGAVNLLGERIERFFPKSEWQGLLMIMIITAFFSAFIATTAVVAVFIPIILRVARTKNISPTKLLMPLSFAAILGGSSTIIGTSTNLIVNAISKEKGLGGFNIFEFTHIGLIFFAALILYMMFLGRKLIPSRRSNNTLTESYSLKEYLTEIIIKKSSPFISKQINEHLFGKSSGVEVIEVRRSGTILFPEEVLQIKEGDRLIIKGRVDDIVALTKKEGITVIDDSPLGDEDLTSKDISLLEVIVGPNSKLQNKYFDPIKFKRKFQAVPLAIRTSGILRRTRLTEVKLKMGDAFLIEAKKNKIQDIYDSNDLIVLQEYEPTQYNYQKTWIAVITTGVMVLLAAFEILPIVIAAWAGVAVMFITNCISMQKAYEKVQWRVIFLLAGVIPLGLAMEKHGVGLLVANTIVELLHTANPAIIISILFLFTMLLTSIISNNATAILLAPIAISIATQLHLDPKPFLVTIMFGANSSFFTPIGYQTNTLVYGIGNYKFKDFFKVGGIYTIIIWLLASIIIPLLYFN